AGAQPRPQVIDQHVHVQAEVLEVRYHRPVLQLGSPGRQQPHRYLAGGPTVNSTSTRPYSCLRTRRRQGSRFQEEVSMARPSSAYVAFWGYPGDRFFVERDRDELIHSGVSGGRDKPPFRPFDLLQGITYSDAGLVPIAVYGGRDMTVFVECPAGAYPFF